MKLLDLLTMDYPSLIAAVVLLLPTGYTEGGILPHACTGFAHAAYVVTAEVRNNVG